MRRLSLLQRLRGLGARFDGAALQPFLLDAAGAGYPVAGAVAPSAPAALLAGSAAAGQPWPALHHWCLADAQQPLKLAVPAAAAQAAAAKRAAALALQLDGSTALHDGRGALAKQALKLQVKWLDLTAAEAARRIWDSGWVANTAQAHAALLRFQPRRPSFVVVPAGQPAAVQALAEGLQACSGQFTEPVRLLWLGAAPGPGWGEVPA